MPYRLTRAAEADLVSIYLAGAARFGLEQADAYHASFENVFEFLAANPLAARERREITPPIRCHPHRAHLVIYTIAPGGGVMTLRVRHGREDWDAAP